MSTDNSVVNLKDTTTIAATVSSDPIDMLAYNDFNIYWNVSNGPATGAGSVILTIESCDEEEPDDSTAWVTCLPDDGAAFVHVDDTAGGNPHPKSYIKKFSTYFRWVRATLTVADTDSFTTEVRIFKRAS